jgi:hypothetical protein
VLEGDDATTDNVTPTVRLGNICQISDKVARVTGTQQSVEHAGRDDELAYQEMLKGLELKRDMETVLAGTNQANNTCGTSTARLTASVLSWIKSNTSKGVGGGDPATADGLAIRTDGTQRAFTEANLKSVLQSIWNNGGKPDVVMAGGFNKQVFSTFTGRATPTEETKSKKIVASVAPRLPLNSSTSGTSPCRGRRASNPGSTIARRCRAPYEGPRLDRPFRA